MKRPVAATALLVASFLLSSCSSRTVGAEEIVRIEGGNWASFGTICDSPTYALDLTTGEFWELIPRDESGKPITEPSEGTFEHMATLTTEEIADVRTVLGAERSSALLNKLEKAAKASQSNSHRCEDGGGSDLEVTYSDGAKRTIRTGSCGIDGEAEVLAPLDILPSIGREHGLTGAECSEILWPDLD